MLGMERRKRSENNTVKVEAMSVTETELCICCVRYSLDFGVEFIIGVHVLSGYQ